MRCSTDGPATPLRPHLHCVVPGGDIAPGFVLHAHSLATLPPPVPHSPRPSHPRREVAIFPLPRGPADRLLARPDNLGRAVLTTARMGGYLNREHDPAPGNQIMWQDYTRLATIAQFYERLIRLGPTSCLYQRLPQETTYSQELASVSGQICSTRGHLEGTVRGVRAERSTKRGPTRNSGRAQFGADGRRVSEDGTV